MFFGPSENLWQAYAAAASLLGPKKKKKLHISWPHSGVDQIADGGRTLRSERFVKWPIVRNFRALSS